MKGFLAAVTELMILVVLLGVVADAQQVRGTDQRR